MRDLIKRYIEETSSLLDKQASEMDGLRSSLSRMRSGAESTRSDAEELLDKIGRFLEERDFDLDSVVDAVKQRNADLLRKTSEIREADEWGALDDGDQTWNNLKPSKRRLFQRLGLI